MLASRQNIFFGIITIIVLIPYLAGWVLPKGFDAWILLISLAITGVPHGAIDHVIFLQNQGVKKNNLTLLRSFFTPYLCMISATFVLWFAFPALMFWFFLLVAAYHFGQSQLFYISSPKNSSFKPILYIFWGIFILSSLWIFHWQEQSVIINSVFNWDLKPKAVIYNLVLWFVIFSGIITILLMFLLYRKGIISLKNFSEECAVLLLLTALFYFTPPYLGFAIYFGLWHATRVIITEYYFLKNEKGNSVTPLSFIKSFLPFSIVSFFGLGLLFWLSQLFKASISPFMLFLIFISALTMPHAFFMERMYKFLGRQMKTYQSSQPLQTS